MNDLDFSDLSSVELTVKVGTNSYVLREATGEAARRYRNAVLRSIKLGSDGKPSGSMEGLADTESLLISLCLFYHREAQPEVADTNKPVSQALITAWPSRVVKTLFDRAKAISRLDEEKETKASLTEKMAKLKAELDALEEDEAKNGH